MLNGSPLNGAPLNGALAAGAVPEPEYVVRGVGYRWRLRLMVGGLDMTAQLAGGADGDREEGAAGVGGFDLYIAPGTPVVPTDWLGKAVSLDYLSTTGGITTESRRYTGQIASPVWNPTTRLLSCECSDQVQQRVEAMPIAAIDSLVGGYWSADVFEPTEGRSHWDYAIERLSTRPVSLDCSPTGALRVTSWYAAPTPHFVFGPGTTIYQSLRLDLAPLSSITNRVEIEFSYRYSRLWQRNQQYSWAHPETAGSTGMSGFCWWRGFPSELPNIEMIEDAASANGQTLLAPNYYTLPGTMTDPCNNGVAWINKYTDLLLGASWTGARRWTQTVTETYSLSLATAAGEAEESRIVQRASYSFEIEDEAAEAWTDDPITGGESGASDLHDESRRAAAINVALRAGQTEIIAGHRATLISWDVPTSMAMGVDLTHTLEINSDGVHAVGKCTRIADRFDLGSGSAVTTLTIAVMRGGGSSDPLTLPARLGAGVIGTADSGAGEDLPTQLSGYLLPGYDETMQGFSGNNDAGGGTETFPRRFDAPADEIPITERDENKLTAEQLYRVGIPNDMLEL
ncbi:hypothetical protein [Pseudomonas sp.]|uniref:hypothetical protein n=1 Tax=Pseudomonas sp. TaxID=306 RepID=UPI0027300045|nr:hypothetical protein [Pseudomonas sp.]MDP2244011.1 hypothetical protein [Pseudomonas sp.]